MHLIFTIFRNFYPEYTMLFILFLFLGSRMPLLEKGPEFAFAVPLNKGIITN